MYKIFFTVVILLISVSIQAVQDKDLKSIAYSKEWLQLVHYEKKWTGYESFADDDRFFLSDTGKVDPYTELVATVRAIQDQDLTKSTQCQFPARTFYLKRRLQLNLPSVYCEELEQWIEKHQPESVTLIFPAAYINSPSSMFGHTLLRINTNNQQEGTSLLNYSFSYAADAQAQDNGLKFTIKGLFGGYPGSMFGAYYYQKVKEYSDIESRDIWEYDLNLTKDETLQLIRHAWELKKVRFDYYFFDENCAYRLLTLIDVARPSLNLGHQFLTYAIPADTVRAVVEANIIKKVTYRPSLATQIDHLSKTLTHKQIKEVVTTVKKGNPLNTQKYNKDQSIKMLDLAYEYSRYQAIENPELKAKMRQRSLSILKQRSKLGQLKYDIPEPERPDLGHKTTRLALKYGRWEDLGFTQLQWRPAFHDLLDHDEGYNGTSRLNFFDATVRIFEDDRVLIDQFQLIDIASYAPRNQLFQPSAWKIRVGWEQRDEYDSRYAKFNLEGGRGLNYEVVKDVNVYGFLEVNGSSDAAFGNNFAAGAGVNAGTLVKVKQSKLMIEARARNYTISDYDFVQYKAEWNLPFNTNNALRAGYQYTETDELKVDHWTVGWHGYF